jgi:glycosyltransferase 2 family protein
MGRVWATADLRWLLPAIAAFSAEMFVRALRWKDLLKPLRVLTAQEVGKPLLVGYALNYIFPARLGELFRAHYARDIFKLSRSSVLGTIVAERAFDLVAVVVLLVAGIMTTLTGEALSQSLPLNLLKTSLLVLALIAVGILGLWLILRSGITNGFPGINRRVTDFTNGLYSISRGHLPVLLATTVVIWSLEIIAIWCMLAAAGVELSMSHMVLVMGCVSLSTLITNAPGFIGTFQFAFFVSLGLIGYEGTHGVLAATFVQLCLYLPIMIIGIVLMLRSGIKIR